jgi:hypothetical protein
MHRDDVMRRLRCTTLNLEGGGGILLGILSIDGGGQNKGKSKSPLLDSLDKGRQENKTRTRLCHVQSYDKLKS